MKEFSYNKQYPAPTDRYVIPIYQDFVKAKKEIVESWKRGVINQLMSQRHYADLLDCRMTIKQREGSITPVMSLIPVIGHENEERLREYTDFFRLYTNILSMVIAEVWINIDLSADEAHRRDSTNVIYFTNILKLMISSKRSDTFDIALFNSLDLSPHDQRSYFNIRARELPYAHVVGDHFVETGDLTKDVDTDLIGSFYHYVRVLMNIHAERTE